MNDHYGWKTMATILGVVALIPLTIFGGSFGLILGSLGIAFLCYSHYIDTKEHERLLQQEKEKAERLKERREEIDKLNERTDRLRKEVAEIKKENAEILKATYSSIYGDDYIDKLRQ